MKNAASFAGLGLFAASLVASLGLHVSPAAACKCAQLTPAQAKEEATAVFEGHVVEVSELPGPPAQRQVRLKVVRAWKGVTAEELVIRTPAESAACGVELAKDQSYLVYATQQDDTLRAHSCSRTKLLAEADEDLQVLGMGATPVDPNGGLKPIEKPSAPPVQAGCASCAIGRPQPSSRAPLSFALAGALAFALRRYRRRG